CIALGLKPKKITDGTMYIGYANNKYCRVPIHDHAKGRDVPTPTFYAIVKKELGFASIEEFQTYLNNI
ncbi:MAG TPA: hypothetical protein VHT34_00980, partial [Clostridia bacterium]|nr:hypothetical protein [Clostridia bacterium]